MTTNGQRPARPIPSTTRAIWVSSIMAPRRRDFDRSTGEEVRSHAALMDYRALLESNHDVSLSRTLERARDASVLRDREGSGPGGSGDALGRHREGRGIRLGHRVSIVRVRRLRRIERLIDQVEVV